MGSLNGIDHVVFDLLVSAVFVIIALMLLFPSNAIIPLDRRLSSLFGATLCTGIMTLFPATIPFNTGGFVDFNVLLVLTAIMVINYLLLRQPWLANAVKTMQGIIQADVDRGFYAVSIISFLASPFILNDGLCLMLVHPVLDAFVAPSPPDSTRESGQRVQGKKFLPSDAFYYMLTIACSANIGSVMTFSGNPQNLIVAQYVGKYMNCGTFFLYMFIPATISWLITIALLNYYRKQAAAAYVTPAQTETYSPMVMEEELDIEQVNNALTELDETPSVKMVVNALVHRAGIAPQLTTILEGSEGEHSVSQLPSAIPSPNISTKKKSKPYRVWEKVLQDPALDPMACPMIVFPGFLLLIVLEFTGTYPLPGLFSVLTVFIIVAVVMTNYYYQSYRFLRFTTQKEKPAISEEGAHGSSNKERHEILAMKVNKVVPPSVYAAHITAMIEDLFHHHIDYNLLIIFIGLFIVSGSFLTTHIPRTIWSTLAGPKPFTSFSSVVVLSVYVIGMSQLVGNVPVVYMAKEEVVLLENTSTQVYAWLLLAYVSTIAGNFTLVGSAANIIVVEKAMRHKQYPVFIHAIPHFKICGLVTLVCIGIGILCLYLETLMFL